MIYKSIYDKNLTMSSEELDLFIENFHIGGISEYITEASSPDAKLSKLSKLGVKINKGKIQQVAKNVADIFKKKGITKESKKEAKDLLFKFYDDTNNWLDTAAYFSGVTDNDKILSKFSTKKVYKAILLLSCVIVAQTIFNFVLNSLVPGLGSVAGSILVAPITEEGSKAMAARGGYIDEYNAVFNIFEFTEYVIHGESIKGRLIAVLSHSLNSFMHKIANDREFREKFNIQIDEKEEAIVSKLVLICMTVEHAVWNYECVSSTINSAIKDGYTHIKYNGKYKVPLTTVKKWLGESSEEENTMNDIETVFEMVALQEKYKTDEPIKDFNDYRERVKQNIKYTGTDLRGPFMLGHEDKRLSFLPKLKHEHPDLDNLINAIIEADEIYMKAEGNKNFDKAKYKKGIDACNKGLDIFYSVYDTIGTVLCLSIVGFFCGIIMKWTVLIAKGNREQQYMLTAMTSVDRLEKIAKKSKDPKVKKKCKDTIDKIEKANKKLRAHSESSIDTEDDLLDLVY